MARRRTRTDQQRGCVTKKRYAGRRAALDAIRGLGDDGAFTPRLQAYRCRWSCPAGTYHVGHILGRRR